MEPVDRDPYVDVELIEKALALALRIPRFPPRTTGKGVSNARSLGTAFQELEQLLTGKGAFEFRRLWGAYRPPSASESGRDFGSLSLSTWAARPNHFAQRHALIDSLIGMRSTALDRLRLYPVPDKRGSWERAAPWTFFPEVPKWGSLDDLDQRILFCLAEKRMTAKEVAGKLKKRGDVIRRAIAVLAAAGILRRVGKDGYVIALVPLGAPESIVATA